MVFKCTLTLNSTLKNHCAQDELQELKTFQS